MASTSPLRSALAFVAAATLAGCATVNGSNDNGHTVLGDLKSSATELTRKGASKVAELRLRGTLSDPASYAPVTLGNGKQLSFAEIVVTSEDNAIFKKAASDAAAAVVATAYPAPGAPPAENFVAVGVMNGVRMGFTIANEEVAAPGKQACTVATLLAAPEAPVVVTPPAKPAKKGATPVAPPAKAPPQAIGFGKVCP